MDPDVTGTFSLQDCALDSLGPYTVTLSVKDYADNTYDKSTTLWLRER